MGAGRDRASRRRSPTRSAPAGGGASRGGDSHGGASRGGASRGGDAHGSLRTLNRPRRARVRVAGRDASAAPLAIDGAKVEAVRETWLLEDGWWTERPLRRRYWEMVGAGGRSIVVFHDLCTGHWFTQAG